MEVHAPGSDSRFKNQAAVRLTPIVPAVGQPGSDSEDIPFPPPSQPTPSPPAAQELSPLPPAENQSGSREKASVFPKANFCRKDVDKVKGAATLHGEAMEAIVRATGGNPEALRAQEQGSKEGGVVPQAAPSSEADPQTDGNAEAAKVPQQTAHLPCFADAPSTEQENGAAEPAGFEKDRDSLPGQLPQDADDDSVHYESEGVSEAPSGVAPSPEGETDTQEPRSRAGSAARITKSSVTIAPCADDKLDSSEFHRASGKIMMDALDKLTKLASTWEEDMLKKMKSSLQVDSLASRASSQHSLSPDRRGSNRSVDSAQQGFPWKNCMRKSTTTDSMFSINSRFQAAEEDSPEHRDSVSSLCSAMETRVPTVSRKSVVDKEGLLKVLAAGDDRQDSSLSSGQKRKQASIISGTSSESLEVVNKGFRETLQELRYHLHTRKENLEILLDQAMGIIIIINTFTIGLSCDVAPDSSSWLIVDTMFAAAFTMEACMKICILGVSVFFCGTNRYWNVFELLLVVFAWVELLMLVLQSAGGLAINISLFRLIRLVRITRIVRLARAPIFTDLMMMLNGAVGGIKTFMWSVVLILVPLYGVALVMRETMGREDDLELAENFSSMPLAMFTLFRCVVAGDCMKADGRPIFAQKGVNVVYIFIYVILLLLMTFGLFNVIVAIFVENTVAAAKYNDLHMKRQRLLDHQNFCRKACELVEIIWRVLLDKQPPEFETIRYQAEALGEFPSAQEIVEQIGGFEISHEFFQMLGHDHLFGELLRDLDIAQDDQQGLFETFDVDGSGTLALHELIFGIRKLRGDPRRSDIISTNLLGQKVLVVAEELNQEVTDRLEAQDKLLRKLCRSTMRVEAAVNPNARRTLSQKTTGLSRATTLSDEMLTSSRVEIDPDFATDDNSPTVSQAGGERGQSTLLAAVASSKVS